MERRRNPSEITPDYEDSGIFKNPTLQLVVELVPKFSKNSRDDLIIKGFVEGNVPIDVVFAGRRKFQADPVIQRLRALWTQANRNLSSPGDAPEIDAVRCRVSIEGSWRSRFLLDDQGWQTRTHQFYAARWLLSDQSGTVKHFGEPVMRLR
jgi:hypothetical protein